MPAARISMLRVFWLSSSLLFLLCRQVAAQTTSVIHHDPVVGDVHAYVYAVDFVDAQVPCTFDDMETVAQQVATFYGSNSFGQLAVVTHVIQNPQSLDGHFKVDHPCSDLLTNTSRYDTEIWDDIKTSTGLDFYALSQTPNVKIIKEYSCFRGGSAGQGSPLAQVGRCWDAPLLVHEFGHTLGMAHASKNRPPGSHAKEYGDRADVMGKGTLDSGLNAPHRMQMGWIPASSIQTVVTDSEITLTDLEYTPVDGTASNTTTVIRIPKTADLVDSPLFKDYYYISLQSGRVKVHGVEVAPVDTEQNEVVFGNTLLMGNKTAINGTFIDKSGRFSLTSLSTTLDDARITISGLGN